MSRIINTPARIMVGATSSIDGIAGIVPTPTLGNETLEFLRKDGTWATPIGSGGGGGGGGGSWGSIAGTLSAQTDLNSALNLKASNASLTSHTGNTSNPHSTTKAQVGLSAVTNDVQLKAADLDTDVALTANSNAKIPSQAAVRAYVLAHAGGSNNWGAILGTISAQTDLASALGAKADSSSLTSHTGNTSNPHSVTKAQVGLGSADNTADVAKVVAGAASGKKSYHQVGHGFAAGQVVYNNAGTWALAKADNITTCEGLAFVESVSADDFMGVKSGDATTPTLTSNTVYFLSDATAGLLTSTEPTNAAHFSVTILRTSTAVAANMQIGAPLPLVKISPADITLDVDATMAANSDVVIASQKATKAADAAVAAAAASSLSAYGAATVVFSNKTIVARIVSVAFGSSIAFNADTTDVLLIGALTGNITLANPTGTPHDGQALKIRVKQDGTGGRTVTLGANFRVPSSATLPLAWSTTASKGTFFAAIYNLADDKWDVVSLIPGY